MKKLILLTLMALTCFSQMRTVAGVAHGQYYNEVWKKWAEKKVNVSVDIHGDVYIKVEGNLGDISGVIAKNDLESFNGKLKKYEDWAFKAKQNQVEINKILGDFMFEYHGKHGKRGVLLTFHSEQKGQVARLIVDIIDYKNGFMKTKIYMVNKEINKLITMIEKAPETLKELSNNKKKSDMFD